MAAAAGLLAKALEVEPGWLWAAAVAMVRKVKDSCDDAAEHA